MTLQERIRAPKTLFFKKVCAIGLSIAAAGVTVLVLPLLLPIAAEQVARCVAAAGGTATIVSRMTVGGKGYKPRRHGKYTIRR